MATVLPQSDSPAPVRPGEHACCHFDRAEDGDTFSQAFVRDALLRGHRVVCLHGDADLPASASRLADGDVALIRGISSGRIAVRAVRPTGEPERLWAQRTIAWVRQERDRALDEGHTGLTTMTDLSRAADELSAEAVAELERRLDDIVDGTLAALCRYDGAIAATRCAAAAATHAIEILPGFASLGQGGVAVAHLRGEGTLRLSGELDLVEAAAAAAVVDGLDGDVRLDLADLRFVDLAGLQALRGTTRRPVTVVAASQQVQRLMRLVAFGAAPGVHILADA